MVQLDRHIEEVAILEREYIGMVHQENASPSLQILEKRNSVEESLLLGV